MLKQCCALVLMTVLFGQIGFSFAPLVGKYKTGQPNIVFRILETLFNNCKLDLKNIIILDATNNITIMDHLNLPIGQKLITEKTLREKYYDDADKKDLTEIQGFVGIIDGYTAWRTIRVYLSYDWYCNKNCTTILVSPPGTSCSGMMEIFKYLQYANFLKVYYICLQNPFYPSIYTYISYINVNHTLPYWHKFRNMRKHNHTTTVFYKNFRDPNFCRGLDFDRILPLNESRITVGIFVSVDEQYESKTVVDNGLIVQKDKRLSVHYERADAFRKILNTTLRYWYMFTLKEQQYLEFLQRSLLWTPTDIVMNQVLIADRVEFVDFSYPVSYEEFVIISHNQGYATPLERIATFYGFWTLGSLIFLLALTFIVIWWKTGRNIARAAFDIIRLLINSGVNIPLTTLSLKIFFCMIFLYFLIIHALFSGHIAEFLTIPALRKNIDSIEDLKTPRIKTIYSLGNFYENIDDAELLKKKTVEIGLISQCFEMVVNHSDTACIGPYRIYRQIIDTMKLDEKLYISRSRLPPTISSLAYSKRFPFQENFNWALMALTETGILNRQLEMNQTNITMSQKMKEARSHFDFRPIRLKDLKFAFIFLIIGNSLATICFVIELVVGRYKMNSKPFKMKKGFACKNTLIKKKKNFNFSNIKALRRARNL